MQLMDLTNTSNQQFIWQQAAWPNFVVNANKVTESLMMARQSQGKLLGMANAIGVSVVEDITHNRYVQEVIATCAIEGETLNPKSVRSSVLRKLGIKNLDAIDADSHAPSKSTDGLVNIVEDAIQNCSQDLSEQRLQNWHLELFPHGGGIRGITIGAYRHHTDPMQIVSGKLGQEVIHYIAPQSAAVPAEMQRYLAWLNQRRSVAGLGLQLDDSITRAAIAHLWFECIHPFEDGNGRLGRVIIEKVIAQDERLSIRLFSLSEQILKYRSEYYDALYQAQHGDLDVSAWVQWFAKIYSMACEKSCTLMQEAIQKSQYWNTYSEFNLNARQKKIINRLLNDGDAGFLGGLNVEKYIKITSTSKATGTRDLAELVQANMLFTIGQGKALRYFVNVIGWGHGVR
jgi:Fic family protein